MLVDKRNWRVWNIATPLQFGCMRITSAIRHATLVATRSTHHGFKCRQACNDDAKDKQKGLPVIGSPFAFGKTILTTQENMQRLQQIEAEIKNKLMQKQ